PRSCGPLQRLAATLRRGRVGIGLRERLLCFDDRPPELDERVARDRVPAAGRCGHGLGHAVCELLLQLEHDALGRLLADARDRLEARRVLERDRAPKLGDRRARDDRERDLRADAVDGQELDEQLALARLGKTVELQRVLANVQVRVERDLLGAVGLAYGARRRRAEIATAADVEDEAVARGRPRPAAQARDHAEPTFRSGGASAWQIATASASAAGEERGSYARPRIPSTIV